jgi:hypothetical protein
MAPAVALAESPTVNVQISKSTTPANDFRQVFEQNTWVNCHGCGKIVFSGGKVSLHWNPTEDETLITGYLAWTTPSGGRTTTSWDGTTTKMTQPDPNGGVDKLYSATAYGNGPFYGSAQ